MKQFNSLQDIVNYIKNNYLISDVIRNYIKLTNKGKEIVGICPFHPDSNPSMHVKNDLKLYKCFVCNKGGDCINFVKSYKNISYIEAIKEIVNILNIDIDLKYLNSHSQYSQEDEDIFALNQQVAYIYNHNLKLNKNENVLQYLTQTRKLPEQLIQFYEIGYASKSINKDFLINLISSSKLEDKFKDKSLLNKAGIIGMNDDRYYDFFSDRFIIPIKNEDHKIVGFSGRTLDPNEKVKYLNTSNTNVFKKDEILFNFYSFDKTKYSEIYLVEGFMDVFAFKKIGIDNVVATMGTAFNENHIKSIKKYPNISTIILCFDNDNAGRNATKNAAEKLLKNNLFPYVLDISSTNFKDFDELVNQLEKDKVIDLIKNQISYVQYEINCLKKSNLTNKDKKLKVKELITWISNNFKNYSLFIDDDINSLSEFGNVSKEIVADLIYKRNDHLNRVNFNVWPNKYVGYNIRKTNTNINNVGKHSSSEKNEVNRLKEAELQMYYYSIFSPKFARFLFKSNYNISFNNDDERIRKVIFCIINSTYKYNELNNYNVNLIINDIFKQYCEHDGIADLNNLEFIKKLFTRLYQDCAIGKTNALDIYVHNLETLANLKRKDIEIKTLELNNQNERNEARRIKIEYQGFVENVKSLIEMAEKEWLKK